MGRLPEYFKFEGAPIADEKKVIRGESYRFTVITDRLIRLEWDESGTFEDGVSASVSDRNFGTSSFEACDREGKLTITTPYFTLEYLKTGRFSKDNLTVLQPLRTPWYFGSPTDNLGGTARTLDRVNGECEIGEGVCSRSGVAVIDDSKSVLIAEDGMLEQRRSYDVCDVYLFVYGDEYLDAVKDYFRLTGRPTLLPAFAMGNWWSRYYKYTEKSYEELMTRFLDSDIPFSVSVIDMDWHLVDIDEKYGTGWTGYTWNKEFFPDYKRFLTWLHDHNLTPSLNLHPADGVRAFEEMYPDMARAVGIDPATEKAVEFDMSSPEFIKAYFDIVHHPYEENGVRFWWLDWQQGTKSTVEGVDPLWMLNHYHTLDAKRDGKREIIFSRFSGAGSQRFTVGFSGDTVITWESLDFQPYFTLTASNIGYPWWSHDIGGHMDGYRDDELTARWVALGAFSPINRLHSSCSKFVGREPWNYSKETELSNGKFLRLRHRMFPYLYSMNYRQHLELEPIIQPLYYHYKNDYAYALKDGVTRNAYFFGSELLVYPITSPADKVSGLGRVRGWLPDGVWVDLFRGSVYHGGRVMNFYRKLDEMPVFAKAGAIVPMNILGKGDNKLGARDRMEIFIFPGKDNRFRIYEDDGDTYEYKKGRLATVDMSLSYTDKKAVFEIDATRGEGIAERSYTLSFRGFSKKARATVYVGGETLKTRRSYDGSTSTLTVTIPKTSTNKNIRVELVAESLISSDNNEGERIFDILLRAHLEHKEKEDIWEAYENAEDMTAFSKYLIDRTSSKEIAEAILEIIAK